MKQLATNIFVRMTGDVLISPAETIWIEIISEDGKSARVIGIPNFPYIQGFAAAVLDGRPLGCSEWARFDKLITRMQYRQIIDLLLKHGLAVYRDNSDRKQGIILTAAGQKAFEELAGCLPNPIQ